MQPAAQTSDDASLKIKGAVIKAPRDWMRTAYGAAAYQRALGKLTAAERDFVDGTLLAGSWYSLGSWDKFHAAMREEARAVGDSDQQFNMRNMREAGSAIVRGVYKFILGLMNATTVLEKAAVIFSRTYSEGRCEVLDHTRGRAILRYSDCDPGLRNNLTHNFPTGIVFVLELNGVRRPEATISRNEVVDGKLVFEVTVTYQA
jgi:hypothetical protein